MRIVKMMDLLMYTDMTLNELAEMTGFVDASHVLKVFSARTGVTPKEYRKIYAGTNNLFKEREKSVSFEVFNYIYHNFQEDLKIQAVADKFGVTVVELNRILLFQAERNFEDFLNYLRVNKACELMLSTKMSITDIAIEVGYNTVKTFSRNFVKLKNMTPATFRKAASFCSTAAKASRRRSPPCKPRGGRLRKEGFVWRREKASRTLPAWPAFPRPLSHA